MPSDKDVDTPLEARLALRARITKQALNHRKEITGRLLMSLLKGGVLDQEPANLLPSDTQAIIGDEGHPKRVPTVPGPLLFVTDEDGQYSVIDTLETMSTFDRPVRTACAKHVQSLSNSQKIILAPHTKDALTEHLGALESDDRETFSKAAIALAKAFDNDWFLSLAGLRQSVAMRFKEGIDQYSDSVFRPTLTSLDFLSELPVWNPSGRQDTIERVRGKVLDSDNLTDVLRSYFRFFGHLPLGGPNALSSVVREWLTKNGEKGNVWRTTWKWTENNGSPLARYHACQLFCQNPSYIPAEEAARFWHEFVAIVNVPAIRIQGPENTEWSIRISLARHFCRHIECLHPGADGERICALAWWLAEKIADEFPDADSRKFIIGLLDNTFSRISEEVWTLARPWTQSHPLHYATLYTNYVWAMSLVSQSSNFLSDLSPSAMSEEGRKRIRHLLNGAVLTMFQGGSPGTYAFDIPVLDIAQSWLAIESEDKSKEELSAYIKAISSLSNDAEIRKSIEMLGTGNEAHDKLFAHYIRCKAFCGNVPSNQLLASIKEGLWHERILLTVDETSLELLVSALFEICLQEREEWISNVPHVLALACMRAGEHSERESLLFAMTVVSQLVTETSSAIERLLSSKNRVNYGKYIEYWRQRLDHAAIVAPQWVQGKFRATRSILYPILP